MQSVRRITSQEVDHFDGVIGVTNNSVPVELITYGADFLGAVISWLKLVGKGRYGAIVSKDGKEQRLFIVYAEFETEQQFELNSDTQMLAEHESKSHPFSRKVEGGWIKNNGKGVEDFECEKCGGTTFNSKECGNPLCPDMPRCGRDASECDCN